MTAYEIVKSAYPGIPDAILNQYADLLPAEAAALNESARSANPFYTAWNRLPVTQSMAYNVIYGNGAAPGRYYPSIDNATIGFIDPQNQNETVTLNFEATIENAIRLEYNLSYRPPDIGYFWRHQTPVKCTVRYDRRLYENVSWKIIKQSGPVSGPLLTRISQYIVWYVGRAMATGQATANKINYAGISTIVAMYENNIIIENVDYDKAYSFLTYVNAYKKFSTQVDAEKALLEQQAKNNVDAYRQQLNDQAAREYSDLQSKKIQLLIAIDNEAKSAQRDYQNMLLTAQTLKQQIGGALGN